MGVVVRRYIDILTIIINFPYSICISSFFDSSIPTSFFCSFFKWFFSPFFIYIYQKNGTVTRIYMVLEILKLNE